MDEVESKYGLVRSRLSAHWYDRTNASPKHEHTLKQARKLGHYPSVTTVLKVYPKEALERWRMTQVVLAALTLPRSDGEDLDTYAKRVVEDSEAEVQKAGDIGKVIHEAVGWRLIEGVWPDNAAMAPFFEHWEKWLQAEVLEVYLSERSYIHPKFGYGGTIDLAANLRSYGRSIIDFKNKEVKDGKPFWADEWFMQLVAYQDMLSYDDGVPRCDNLLSVVVDRKIPGPPYINVWPKHGMDWAWEGFRLCQKMWQHSKRYDPMLWEPPVAKAKTRKPRKHVAEQLTMGITP